jgi:hypothetical protein
MRRAGALTLALAAISLSLAPRAGAQDGYSGGWTDPSPSGSREGKPLAYLQQEQRLVGSVSHPNGIESVNVIVVPDPDDPPPSGCDPSMGPVEAQPSGATATFRVDATFPCNIVYEVRATAQARDGGLTSPTPPKYVMPLYVAVALPPAPVAWVDATLDVDGDDREVLLEWPANSEPDLLGYVISRDGDQLGQIDAGDDTRFVDDDPPAGTTSSYEVTAVRDGPDGDVEQVAAPATTVDVEVPAAEDDDGDGEATPTTVDPGIASDPTPAEESGRPDSGSLLSGVRSRGQAPPAPGPPTTIDTGFQETLPFDPVTGQELAAPPTGDPAVVQIFEETSSLDEKQRLSFIAGGLAVLVGAAAIFYVTRRAARGAY